MNVIPINSSKHRLFHLFASLYQCSFPIFEQRTSQQQEEAFANPQYHLLGYEQDDVFIGFISYWELKSCIYIEHFAINTNLRRQGYGKRILTQFIADNNSTILLEIDPIIDKISLARLRFYQQIGFYQNTYRHAHPSYRKEYAPHNLIILTAKAPISAQTYDQFIEELHNTVMSFSMD